MNLETTTEICQNYGMITTPIIDKSKIDNVKEILDELESLEFSIQKLEVAGEDKLKIHNQILTILSWKDSYNKMLLEETIAILRSKDLRKLEL